MRELGRVQIKIKHCAVKPLETKLDKAKSHLYPHSLEQISAFL